MSQAMWWVEGGGASEGEAGLPLGKGREKARSKVPEATVRGAEGLGDRVGALRQSPLVREQGRVEGYPSA